MREYQVALLVILGTLSIVLIGPLLIWHFTYVTAGDDGANYLVQVLNNEPVHNYGVYLLRPLMAVGISPLQALSLLYYGIMAASIFMTWKLLRQYSLTTAIIGTPLVTIGNYGVWKLWFDGSIFGLGGLLIFNFGAYICLAKYYWHFQYLKTKDYKWLIPFALFMIGGMLFHKATGLYIIGTSLILAGIYKDIKLGLISGLIGLAGLFLWLGDLDPVNSTIRNLTMLNLAILGVYAMVLGVGFLSHKDSFFRLQPTTQILLVLILVIIAGTFIKNPYQYRMQLDSLTIMLIFVSVMIAKGLIFMPARYKGIAYAIAIGIPLLLSNDRWMSDYQAIHAEDLQAIETVNTMANINPLTIATSYGESPTLLRFYFNKNVTITTDIEKADIVIFRKDKRTFNEYQGSRKPDSLSLSYLHPRYLYNQVYGLK